jgi:PAS domain S-box-containing protein
MAATRKTPKRTAAAKTGAKSKDAKPRPVKTPRPLSASDAFQVLQNEELRRAQMEVDAARDRYVDLYDFSPAGLLTLDTHGTIVEANLRAGTLFGINRNELVGQSLAHFIAAEDQDTFQRHYQNVLRTGLRQACELQIRNATGASRWVYSESLAVHDEPGRSTHWRTALLDISDRKRAEDEVRRSETFISSILENLPDMIFVKEAKDLRFVRLNKAGEDLLGYLRGELMGKNDYDFFPHDEADFFTATDREVLACGRLLDIPQEPIQTRSGEVRYLHTKKIPIVGKEGTPQYLLGISEDITDRKRVEEALRLAKFSMDRAADAVYWIDSQAQVLDVNEAASLMLGYSKDELCAMTVHDLNPDFQADMWPGYWAESQRRGTMMFETAHRAKNGRLIPIEVSVNYLSYEGKEYHCAFVRDITERKRAEAALQQREVQLESLSAQLLQAQEEERRWIARELHDDFSQRLAALAIDLRTVRLEPSDSKTWGVARLQQLGDSTERLATELQQISHRLHPSILEHVGLEAAVKEHVDEVSARTGLSIEVMVLAVPKDVPLEQALCLYRVLQESLQNVRKHALATTVLVRLFRTGRGLGLCVHDDGQGFANVPGGEGRRGLGVTSMEERVKRHHGTFHIRTKLGEGTEVHAWVPLTRGRVMGDA